MSWLERPYAVILPEYLRALKERSAKSRNKAPIRRVKKATPAPTVVMAQEQAPVPTAMANESPALVASAPRIEAPEPFVAPAPAPQLLSAPVVAQGVPGPLCQALMSILSTMAVEGKFTEQDALSMITNLMAKR